MILNVFERHTPTEAERNVKRGKRRKGRRVSTKRYWSWSEQPSLTELLQARFHVAYEEKPSAWASLVIASLDAEAAKIALARFPLLPSPGFIMGKP